MATLPASGYLSDNARTKGEQKVAFEDQRDFIAQLLGGDAAEALTISAGSITPTRSAVTVATEGAVSSDNLDNIDQTNLPDGSFLILFSDLQYPAVSDAKIVRDSQGGAGEIYLSFPLNGITPLDFTLSDFGYLILRRVGTHWEEVVRHYGYEASADFRQWYDLGSVVTYDNGDAALNAGLLGGIASSGYQLVGAPAGDASTLDGIDSTGFVQTALTSEQTVGGNIRNDTGRFRARSVQGGSPGLELIIDDGGGVPVTDDTVRALFYAQEGSPDAVYLRFLDGAQPTPAVLGELRISDDGDGTSTLEFDDQAGGGYQNVQDALTFDGETPAQWEAKTIGVGSLGELAVFNETFVVPDGGSYEYSLPRGTVWYGMISKCLTFPAPGNDDLKVSTLHPQNEGGGGAPSDVFGRTMLFFENDHSVDITVRVKGYYLDGIGPT